MLTILQKSLSLSLLLSLMLFLMASEPAQAQTPSHPHLFFDKSGMDELRGQVSSNSRLRKIWEKYKATRLKSSYQMEIPDSREIAGENEARAYGDALADMGIAYVILRDQTYVNKALEMMRRLAGKETWGTDLSTGHISMGFALCWDVMYSQFSEDDKAMILDAVQRKANNHILSDPYSNHNWTASAGEGLVGLAFQGDGDFAFNQFVSQLLNGAKKNFKESDRSVLWAHGTDGFPHQGLGYWRKYAHVGMFLTALRFNQPQNDWFHLGKEFPGCEFLKNTAFPRIYADVQNPTIDVITWADSRQVSGDYGNLATLTLVASEYKEGYALDFIDYLLDRAGVGFDGEDYATFLFYDDSGISSKRYTDLPLSRYWPDLEAAIFRSGWDRNAMVFYMRSGSPGGHGRRIKSLPTGGHNHPDANGYVIFYNNDYLAAEDGASPLLGPDAGVGDFTYGHNTFLIDGRGQRGDGGTNIQTTSANMDYIDAEHVGYLLGDATDAYSGIDRVYRYVIYKKHKYFIIVDELQDNSSHTYEFLLGTDSHHTIKATGSNKFAITPEGGGRARMPVVFIEPKELSSDINRDRAYAMDRSMVEMLRVSPRSDSPKAVFFTLQYPRRAGDSDPSYKEIYEGNRSGVVVDGNEYYLYNDGAASYSYGNVRTNARLCYYKDDANTFEYLAAGCTDFRYNGSVGISSDKAIVATFKGASGKIRVGKNLGSNSTTTITLHHPGINGVEIDGRSNSPSANGAGWVSFQLSPKQHRIGPGGNEQTVTDNYDVEILGGGRIPPPPPPPPQTTDAPIIESFIPENGEGGIEVVIKGENFRGTTTVAFNGFAATNFTRQSDTQIRATVPSNATTGKIEVTTGKGSAFSRNDFRIGGGSGGGTGTSALVFQSSHDTFVKSSSESANFGSLTAMRVRDGSNEALNGYLKFRARGLRSSVALAKLRLYVIDASRDGGSVYAVSNNYQGSAVEWEEDELNWKNAPAISGDPLDSRDAPQAGAWVEFDVTSAINGNGIYSFAIKSNSSDAVTFTTKQSNRRPELVIETRENVRSARSALDEPTDNAQTESASLAEEQGQIFIALPTKFDLHQNYPNPFNPETQIGYELPSSSEVQLTIHDALGREVVVLVEGIRPAGYYSVVWDGRDARGERVGSGVYFYHLRAGEYHATRKMMMVQ